MGWNERYLEKNTPWDKGAPAPPLVDALKSNPEYFQGGVVLVPGCGRGHDCLALSKAGYQAIGLDISPAALDDARALDPRSLVDYQIKDFLVAEKEDFPEIKAIFEHTCFCAINPAQRVAYRDACVQLIPKGGYWIAIIFLTPREEDDPAIGPPFQSKVEDVKALFSPHFVLLESYVPKNVYNGRQGKELVMVWKRK